MPISDLTGPVTSIGSATAIADGAIGVAKISGLGTLATLNDAPAGTLTGNTLAAGVTASSLTSVGTLAALTVTAPINGSVTGNAGTVTTNANLTGPITSVGNATSVAAQTGTGSTFVMQASPTLTTPDIGVATATSINKVTITAPASSATLTIANSKTLTVNNSITLSGTDATVMTLPATSATIARTDAAQSFTGVQTFNGAIEAISGIRGTAGGSAITINSSGDVSLPGARRFSTTGAGFFGTSAQTTTIEGSTFIRLNSASALVVIGGADVASPAAQTLAVSGVVAGTNDTAGQDRTYTGSASTGNQVGGGHIFKTTPPGSSGTTQNAQVTAFSITGLGTALTTASTTARSGLRIPSGTAPTSPTSGDFWYDGTNLKFQDGATTRTLTWT